MSPPAPWCARYIILFRTPFRIGIAHPYFGPGRAGLRIPVLFPNIVVTIWERLAGNVEHWNTGAESCVTSDSTAFRMSSKGRLLSGLRRPTGRPRPLATPHRLDAMIWPRTLQGRHLTFLGRSWTAGRHWRAPHSDTDGLPRTGRRAAERMAPRPPAFSNELQRGSANSFTDGELQAQINNEWAGLRSWTAGQEVAAKLAGPPRVRAFLRGMVNILRKCSGVGSGT